jgi:hypothetical protein
MYPFPHRSPAVAGSLFLTHKVALVREMNSRIRQQRKTAQGDGGLWIWLDMSTGKKAGDCCNHPGEFSELRKRTYLTIL